MHHQLFKNNLFILSFLTTLFCTQQIFNMEIGGVPRLSQLAFNVVKPQLEKQVTAIATDDTLDPIGRLEKVELLMGMTKQIDHFVINHPATHRFINEKAQNSYQQIKNGEVSTFISEHTSCSKMKHLHKRINAALEHYFLRKHYVWSNKSTYGSLPTISDSKPTIYAACLLNKDFLLAPLDKIIKKLHPKNNINLESVDLLIQGLANISKVKSCALVQQIKNSLVKAREKAQSDLNQQYRYIPFSYSPIPEVTYKPSEMAYDSHAAISYAAISKERGIENSVIQSLLTKQFGATYALNGKKVAINNMDHTITVYCLKDGDQAEPIILTCKDVKKVCFSADGIFLFATCGKKLYTYDLVKLEGLGCYSFNQSEEIQALCATDFDEISLIKSDNTRHCYSFCSFDMQQQKWGDNHVRDLEDATTIVTAACFSHDGKLMAIGCSNGELLLINKQAETTLWTLKHCDKTPIHKIIFSQDSSVLMTLIEDSTVCIWHTDSGECIHQFCLERAQAFAGEINDTITITEEKKREQSSCLGYDYPSYNYSSYQQPYGYSFDNSLYHRPSSYPSSYQSNSYKEVATKKFVCKFKGCAKSYMPLVLLNLSSDDASSLLSDLKKIGWEKTINGNALIMEEVFDNSVTINDIKKFEEFVLTNKDISSEVRDGYVERINAKIDRLKKQEEERREAERQEQLRREKEAIERAAIVLQRAIKSRQNALKAHTTAVCSEQKKMDEKIDNVQNFKTPYFSKNNSILIMFTASVFVATMMHFDQISSKVSQFIHAYMPGFFGSSFKILRGL